MLNKTYVVQHSYELNGYDETKFIGVYSSREKAREAVKRLIKQPGFMDRANDFYIDDYEIDKDHWQEGYVTSITE